MFCLCFCMSEVISSFRIESWITGVCSPHVISLSDFAYYVFGQESAVAVHLALWYVLLVCHQYVCENSVCMCVVNKQFELLEFVSESVYVDLQYDEIYLTFTAGFVWCW